MDKEAGDAQQDLVPRHGEMVARTDAVVRPRGPHFETGEDVDVYARDKQTETRTIQKRSGQLDMADAGRDGSRSHDTVQRTTLHSNRCSRKVALLLNR